MSFAGAMLVALALDVAVGWPDALYRRIGHPVSWIGRAISAGEKALNKGNSRARRGAGAILVVLVLSVCAAIAWRLSSLLQGGWAGVLLTGILAWAFVAARSLHEHVSNVADPLEAGETEAARRAVSHIVGRNPETMDAPAIGRAALESLAENASDGVVAPLFWGAIFGLPGIVVYKALNTLDSMIGHRNARYRDFGWAAARLDDLANLLPARLTGVLIALAATGVRRTALRTMQRDARKHRSPNAGWPEAAMAGALGVRMSGPRVYDGVPSDDPWLNPVANDPTGADVRRGLRLYRRAVGLFALLLFFVSAI
ncbi:MAG: adenosylcobinamide-phosphate synthase CbiB [Silicimonas sp.]|nr:adenosylcobinamide-phosphate synthase CbiB [Silicimonas sp.]